MDEYKGLEVKLESAYFNRNKVGTRVDKYDLVDAAKVIEEDIVTVRIPTAVTTAYASDSFARLITSMPASIDTKKNKLYEYNITANITVDIVDDLKPILNSNIDNQGYSDAISVVSVQNNDNVSVVTFHHNGQTIPVQGIVEPSKKMVYTFYRLATNKAPDSIASLIRCTVDCTLTKTVEISSPEIVSISATEGSADITIVFNKAVDVTSDDGIDILFAQGIAKTLASYSDSSTNTITLSLSAPIVSGDVLSIDFTSPDIYPLGNTSDEYRLGDDTFPVSVTAVSQDILLGYNPVIYLDGLDINDTGTNPANGAMTTWVNKGTFADATLIDTNAVSLDTDGVLFGPNTGMKIATTVTAQPQTVFVVARKDGALSADLLSACTTTNRSFLRVGTTGAITIFAGTSVETIANMPTATPSVVQAVFSGSASKVRVGSNAWALANSTGTAGYTGINIGCSDISGVKSLFFTGKIYAVVVIPVALADSDIAIIRDHLIAKYSL